MSNSGGWFRHKQQVNLEQMPRIPAPVMARGCRRFTLPGL